MSLRTLIQGINGWQSMTAAEIHAALSAMTVERINHDLISYAGLGEKIGHDSAAAIRFGIQQYAQSLVNPQDYPLRAFLEYAHWSLDAGKYDPGLSETQSKLEEHRVLLATIGVPVDALKAIGVWSEPVTDATEADVAAELLAISKEAKIDAATDRLQAYREAMSVWNGVSEEPQL